MKKGIRIIGLTLFGILILANCGRKINKENFDFEKHIVGNDELIKELESWDVDSAYIQFIGFAPNEDFEYYKGLSMEMKMSGVYPEEFFEQFDIKQPIIKLWALRKNTYSGNKFDEAGIGSKDLVDYSNGVGKREARSNHSLGDYSGETYEWSSFYLASQSGKLRMLSDGYTEDRVCIDFYNDVIKLNVSYTKEVLKASMQVGMFIKGKGIIMAEPSRLRSIQSIILNKKSSEASAIVADSLAYVNAAFSDSLAFASSVSSSSEVSGSAEVVVERTYFYKESNLTGKRKAFLVQGDKVDIIKSENDFIYAVFENNNGKSTTGWLLKSDFNFNN
jgi:hypothetical protein